MNADKELGHKDLANKNIDVKLLFKALSLQLCPINVHHPESMLEKKFSLSNK